MASIIVDTRQVRDITSRLIALTPPGPILSVVDQLLVGMRNVAMISIEIGQMHMAITDREFALIHQDYRS